MSRSNVCPFLKLFGENVFVWTKVELMLVDFTLMFLQVIKIQPYLERFFEESIKTGFLSRSNVFLFLPLTWDLGVLGIIFSLENVKQYVCDGFVTFWCFSNSYRLNISKKTKMSRSNVFLIWPPIINSMELDPFLSLD